MSHVRAIQWLCDNVDDDCDNDDDDGAAADDDDKLTYRPLASSPSASDDANSVAVVCAFLYNFNS